MSRIVIVIRVLVFYRQKPTDPVNLDIILGLHRSPGIARIMKWRRNGLDT
jgi:hypothetical protein